MESQKKKNFSISFLRVQKFDTEFGQRGRALLVVCGGGGAFWGASGRWVLKLSHDVALGIA